MGRPLLILVSLAVAPLAFSQPGSITGTIVDTSGASVARARVKLLLDGRAPDRETLSSESGTFSFTIVVPGPFQLSVNGSAFAVKTISGELHAGEALILPQTALAVERLDTEVNVTEPKAGIAEAEIKQEEQQRFIGLLPNYFVSYDPHAAPLRARQKFELTWKTFLDPATFAVAGISAGVGQIEHTRKDFGQGVEGYAKRYGASYGDFVVGELVHRAVMPILFKQDPRYFYKGAGSARSRFFYAISRSVICRGDNKQEQFCYSTILGRFATGFLVNLSYPSADRNSTAQTLENGAIGIGGRALGNLFQEFIADKLTRKKH